MSVRKHLLLDSSILIGFAAFYIFTLFNYQWLAPHALPKVDLRSPKDTVVKLHIENMQTKENLLDVKLVLKPDEAIVDKRTGRLNADTAVRFPMQDDMGEVHSRNREELRHRSKPPSRRGVNPRNWPLDTYTTDVIRAEWLVGAGESSHYEPPRSRWTGRLTGSISTSPRSRTAPTTSSSP